jgi:hypothetical protein
VNAAEFGTELWGETPPGLILVWRLSTKKSAYFKSPLGLGGIPPTERDVYVGCGLAAADHGSHRRTPNDKVCAIAGLWADIDVNGGPDEKRNAAADKAQAIALAGAVADPTLIVDSGYGIQAWWLFEGGPWRFQTYGEQRLAARASAQWQKLLRQQADFGLDYTHDLARILRLPGTVNGKGGERVNVTVLDQGPRHERDELLELAAQAGDVDPGYAIGERRSVSVSCRPDTQPAKLDDLLARSPAFGRVWRHERRDLPSMSEHDMALVSIAALAGWSDQELADLICHHRRARDPQDPKASRLDYVSRTVAKAREAQPEPTSEPASQPGVYLHSVWGREIERTLKATDEGAIELPWQALTEAMDGGLRPGEVCLVAGYTSQGKSVVVDQIADCAAEQERKVHLYLTEMTAYQRGLRLLARKARIPFSKLRRRELSLDDWDKAREVLDDMPYGCSIVSDWTVEDVVADIRQARWDLAVVDLIHGFHYQDERDLSKTSSALVRAAKGSTTEDFAGTSIVCAAHLNDGQMRDQRSNRRPKPGLHSIKGSSSLKQDADTVMFVWREDDADGLPQPNGTVWIAKSRQGGFAGVEVSLDAARMEFVERQGADVVELRSS